MAPEHIADYAVLPLALPKQSSLQLDAPALHTLYIRPHAPKIPTESDSRSLFLVNVPVDSTSTHLRTIFTTLIGAGRFESVSFEGEKKATNPSSALALSSANDRTASGKKRKRGSDVAENGDAEDLPRVWDRDLHRSGSTAIVTLVDDKSVESVLKAIRKLHKSTSKGSASWPVWGEGVDNKVSKLGSARYAARQTTQPRVERAAGSNVRA